MADKKPYGRIEPEQLAELERAERPALRIRWGVLPFALALCVAQVLLNQAFENAPTGSYLIATQISVISFAFLFALVLLVNPVLKVTRLCAPLNRAEVILLFAVTAVTANIATFGLADHLIPLMTTPFNHDWSVQRHWDTQVAPFLNRRLFITDPKVLATYYDGLQTKGWVFAQVPWGAWLRPISIWLIFFTAMYLMYYGLSMLLYDTWARREKIVFPLARLPEGVVPDEGAAGVLCATLRSRLFWIGFLAVFLFLGYNGACQAGWIRGLAPIHRGLDLTVMQRMLANTIFAGVTRGGEYTLMFMVFFTGIGIAFLLPLEISFSLWAYKVIAYLLFLIAIWMGVAATMASFPTNWIDTNFVSSLGGGGFLAFAAAYLAKLGYERWAETAARGGKRGRLRFLGRYLRSFGWGGAVFLLAMIVATAWLRWNGVGTAWALLFMALVVLITVGMMRTVAEGGVYWIQVRGGPFQLANIFGGGKTIPGGALAPLMSVFYVLAADPKTFMGPAVVNDFKMQDETRAARRRFHLVVILSIAVTVVASLLTVLYFAYKRGAAHTNQAFFTNMTPYLLDSARRLMAGPLTEAKNWQWVFFLIGGGWVVLSMVMRRRFFWWLHPIGFAMLVNPLMTKLWFSFFLGWVCKKLTVKYGGRHMFEKLRPLFFGLIFGELMACFLWAILAHSFHLDYVRIDIDTGYP